MLHVDINSHRASRICWWKIRHHYSIKYKLAFFDKEKHIGITYRAMPPLMWKSMWSWSSTRWCLLPYKILQEYISVEWCLWLYRSLHESIKQRMVSPTILKLTQWCFPPYWSLKESSTKWCLLPYKSLWELVSGIVRGRKAYRINEESLPF